MEADSQQQSIARYKKGDKLTISHNGQPFEVEVIATTTVEWKLQYRLRYADGSTAWVDGAKLTNQLN